MIENNKNKKCALILPYFGEFNNYFQLFLNSFSYNNYFQLFIFTDNKKEYEYPDNVSVIPFTLERIKEILEEKLGMNICLNTPYKLCDYKPTYGIVFHEYIKDFEYWGHCDCDLIFGNLDKILVPILNKKYDKIFAAGHLTIYRNVEEVNTTFQMSYKNHFLYKEAFSTDSIYIFDEDYNDNNVHRIFMEQNKMIFDEDLSMNPTSRKSHFVRSYYSPKNRCFEWEGIEAARYYWNNGEVFSLCVKNNSLKKREYLYMHLQSRTMHFDKNVINATLYQIKPDSFIKEKKLPNTSNEFKAPVMWFPNRFWFDIYLKKIKKKIRR